MKAATAVDEIASAVVHTKFIGSKSAGSDECVLFKILLVSLLTKVVVAVVQEILGRS